MNTWSRKGRMYGKSPHMFYLSAGKRDDGRVQIHVTGILDASDSREVLPRLPHRFRPTVEQTFDVTAISPTTHAFIGTNGEIMVIDYNTITKDVMLAEFNIVLEYNI